MSRTLLVVGIVAQRLQLDLRLLLAGRLKA
jgi:hypothetical protein